jgi:ABC-2 type transport system ATP-binding protein
VPDGFNGSLTLGNNGNALIYTYDSQAERTGIGTLLTALSDRGIRFKDLETQESSLEDIFVSLVKGEK